MADGFRLEAAECTAATSKAILVSAPDLENQEWIPQGQIHEDSEVWKKGDSGVCITSQWFAEKRGWV